MSIQIQTMPTLPMLPPKDNCSTLALWVCRGQAVPSQARNKTTSLDNKTSFGQLRDTQRTSLLIRACVTSHALIHITQGDLSNWQEGFASLSLGVGNHRRAPSGLTESTPTLPGSGLLQKSAMTLRPDQATQLSSFYAIGHETLLIIKNSHSFFPSALRLGFPHSFRLVRTG